MGVVVQGGHGGGGNNVNTVTIDANAGMSPAAGDIQYCALYCIALNANTDWTTKPTTSGWSQVVDQSQANGSNTTRWGLWSRVYGGAGGSGNPVATGPTDLTTSGYVWEVITLKTSSNRASSGITVDAGAAVDARVTPQALPSLTAAQAQATYVLYTGSPIASPPYPFTNPQFLSVSAQFYIWCGQGLPGNVFLPPGGYTLHNPAFGYVFVASDGGVNNGYALSPFRVWQEVKGSVGALPLSPPTIRRMKDGQLVENVVVVAGSGSGVGNQFGSGGGIIVTP